MVRTVFFALALWPCVFALPNSFDRRATGSWTTAYAKAKTALAQLNNTEKAAIVTGVGWQDGPCVGNTAAVSKIGYPLFCLQDGPLGVRFVPNVTAFPAGVHAASTWDPALIYARGNALGAESKGLGVNVQLGPVAGPLGRNPYGGRNWEGFSPDPYLTGACMVETINGMQDAGVQACAKHYIGNEQETNRNTISSIIDDRTVHELYMWPFEDSVRAGVASIMCSYNQVNGTFACENDHIINQLLKTELGFQGYVMSDWNAHHTTTGAANAGMDMSMPGTDFSNNNLLWGPNLVKAVSNGTVAQSRLDDMVTRILAAWYLLGQDQNYPPLTWSSTASNYTNVPTVSGGHYKVARDIARDGIVLLKNNNGTLPLNKPSSLAVIGQDAIVNPAGPNACTDRGCDTGTLAMGWGSGTAQFPYLVGPADAIKAQAANDGTTIVSSTTDDTTAAASAAFQAATAIVFVNSDSGEGYITVDGVTGDRNHLNPWHSGNSLVQAVANVNKNTIVVVHSVGPVILETILALPNVQAVVWAGLPGQESGNGLAEILYGSTAPNGKLPYTIAKQASDYGTSTTLAETQVFTEGLYIDYRHFDKSNIAPRYEFGYGLSYTTFSYSSLTAVCIDKCRGSKTRGPGLFDTVGTVTAQVTNNGSVTGAEVAQLYIGLPSTAPDSPPKQLRGFKKVWLAPGDSQTVSFDLRRKDLSYWNVGTQSWVVPDGAFDVLVGASSRDIRLTGNIG